MVSSYTTRNRLLKQGAGDSINLWGDLQNSGDFDLIDTVSDGWTTKTLVADYTLTTANGATDEARSRCLKFNGTGAYTVTIPSVEKFYNVWNNLSGNLTITTGAGATAVLLPGEILFVICDGSNVKRMTLLTMGSARLQSLADPTNPQDAATKNYVDGVAFSSAAGTLPGQTGNAGKFLKTDGTTAGWAPLKYQTDATSHTLTLQASDGVTTLGSLKADTSGHLDLISAAGVNRIRSSTDGTVTTTSDAGTPNTLATVAQAVAFAIAL